VHPLSHEKTKGTDLLLLAANALTLAWPSAIVNTHAIGAVVDVDPSYVPITPSNRSLQASRRV